MEYESIEALIREEQLVSKGNFINSINIEDYLDKIRSKAEFFTYYVKGECAGFVAFYCNDPFKKNAFITLVLVSSRFRRQGISKILLSSVLSFCKLREFKNCSLEVRKNNFSAMKVYSSLGFKVVEEDEEKSIMKIALN